MPFTPSHAVVALPFLRTPLVPAAIAVGAMAPDLALFTRGIPLGYSRTHDLAWLPATVALALGLLLVWRCVLRPSAREVAPLWLARRLPSEWDSGARAGWRETLPARARAILLLVASLAIGVVSHIVWDLFTHEGRWGVSAFPALEAMWGPFAGYKWLQYGSSAAGLAIIAVWMLVWLARRTLEASVPRVLPDVVRWVWWLALPALLVAAWGAGLAVYGPLTEEWTAAHLAYRVLPVAVGAWGVLTILFALVVQRLRAPAHVSA
jgi:hypothetical protein